MQTRGRKRQINALLGAIIFLILGIFMIFLALPGDPNNVTCDGQTMHPGDTCIHTTNGATTSENTYDQEKQSQESSKPFAIIFALVFFGLGIFSLVSFIRTSATAKKGTVSAVSQSSQAQRPGAYPPQNGYPQQLGGYPPQNGYPQQPGRYPQPGTPPRPTTPYGG
jgi:hypothetical protein